MSCKFSYESVHTPPFGFTVSHHTTIASILETIRSSGLAETSCVFRAPRHKPGLTTPPILHIRQVTKIVVARTCGYDGILESM